MKSVMDEMLAPNFRASYRALHDVGVSWEYMAEKWRIDKRTLKRRQDEIVFEENICTDRAWVETTMRKCNDLVNGYSKSKNYNLKSTKENWDEVRELFEENMKFYYSIRTMDDGKVYDRMEKFNKARSEKKEALLEQIKPVFDSLPEEKRKAIVYCFEGYVCLQDHPYFPYVHFLTEEQKNDILEKMYQRTWSGKELINSLCFGNATPYYIVKMLNYNGTHDRGGDIELWSKFQKQMKGLGYECCRSISAALRCEIIQSIGRTELLIYLGHMLSYDPCSPRMDWLILKVVRMLSEDAHMRIDEYEQLLEK